jgi:hypothetical protein
MIICFYPGGGGNRYYNSINNKEYETTGRSYDLSDRIFGDHLKFRYLNDSSRYEYDDDTTILTHCLNFEKIKYHFPKKTKFVVLDTEFKSSIRRQWCLDGKILYKKEEKKYSNLDVYNNIKEKSWPDVVNENELKNLPNYLLEALDNGIISNNYYSGPSFDNINSAFSSICYHRNYYDTYPPTMLSSPGIDIIDCRNNGTSTEFSKVIINELDRYASEIFDFAWDAFDSLGESAPVLSMWGDLLKLKFQQSDLKND